MMKLAKSLKNGDAKLEGPLSFGKGQPAAIKKLRELDLMSNYQWLTPEEVQQKKARKKIMLYAAFILIAVMLSATVTILANQI